jgi:glutamate N-acetyltransferase/amino-acid N-acetyltransferase
VVSIIEMASSAFSVRKEEVLNASTGIIGVHLPMSRLRAGFSSLVRNTEATNGDLLQKAIMTTDLLEKFSSFSIPVDGHGSITAAGIAKGSGMIAPNMGTMFAFIVMNAPVTRHDLDKMTREVCDSTFNMMSVDTDTSTSDMMIVFANGNGEPSRALTEEEYQACYSALYSVSSSLCRQIARDGEGASRLIEVHVHEAASKEDARSIARAVSDSPLVKTAVHGADPNWGRIVMAIGKRPEVFVNPEKVSVQFGTHAVFRNGEPVTFDIDMLRQYLSEEKVEIHVYLGAGSEEAVSWGCDLTRGYIDINTCYN